MNIHIIKHIVMSICCLVVSLGAYASDELYDSELSGLAYFNFPFGSHEGHASPAFGFAIGRTPANIALGTENDLSPFLRNPDKRALFDIQFDLVERRWSRFAFGGINALVYDDVLHADGGDPEIDPTLVVLGLGAAGFLIFIGTDDDNDDDSNKCNQVFGFTSNLADPCCRTLTFTSGFNNSCTN